MPQKILFYGAGAVGLGLTAFLLQEKNSVDIVVRKNTKEKIEKNGFFVNGIFGDFHFFPSEKFTVFEELPKPARSLRSGRFEYEVVAVSTKTFQAKEDAKKLFESGLVTENTSIILFHNGWGTHEIFAEKFSKSQIFSARVMTGFIRENINTVNISVHGQPIHIGNIFSGKIEDISIKDFCNSLSIAGIETKYTEKIGSDIWAKMLFNCSLNPLGAIVQAKYGDLAENKNTKNILDSLIEECFLVMENLGFSTHWENPEEYKKFFYTDLIPLVCHHKSSMLQDIAAGRKTEIDFMTGYIAKIGKEKNMSVPVSEMITGMIKFLEGKK